MGAFAEKYKGEHPHMNIARKSPSDPEVLELFSEHDDFMTDFLSHDIPSTDNWQYARYSQSGSY